MRVFRNLLRRPSNIQTIYLYLVLGNTLATSFIWGINTIFLLNAGLSNFQAFLANAFFTLGEVIFEVPTGIIADTWGRRVSYMLGSLTLTISTLLYLYMWNIKGPFWGWALSSLLLGLGYTFFSGATEAWLVDALHATNFKGHIDGVFAKGQIVGGAATLVGSISGGIIAQATNLGVPYILRSIVLVLNLVTAFFLMKDLGFTPKRAKNPVNEMKLIFKKSIDNGLRNPPVRYLMIASLFTSGVSFYAFYALQPFLLNLYGDSKAYGVAGLVAAIAGLSLIIGGVFSKYLKNIFRKRTVAIFSGILISTISLVLVSFTSSFWVALILIFVWGVVSASVTPLRQAYLNGIIPSSERATVLSFDSLMGSTGGIIIQPVLGKAADLYSYGTSYLIGAGFQALALPFIFLSKKQNAKSDIIEVKDKA